jgi:phage repressor protein C with HTH and peptisase S24 domain
LTLKRVPVINKVAAGAAGEFGDLSYPAGVADAYVGVPEGAEGLGAAFGVKITGDSMMPEYGEGELIVVGPGDPKDGDDCVVRLGPGENFATTFKRVFFVKGKDGEAEGVRLVPLNGAHAERRVKLEEVTGIYPLMYRLVPRKARAKVKASERMTGGG